MALHGFVGAARCALRALSDPAVLNLIDSRNALNQSVRAWGLPRDHQIVNAVKSVNAFIQWQVLKSLVPPDRTAVANLQASLQVLRSSSLASSPPVLALLNKIHTASLSLMSHRNPLLVELSGLLDSSSRALIVWPYRFSSRRNQAQRSSVVLQALAVAPRVELSVDRDLRIADSCQELTCILALGKPEEFPPHLRTAPRALLTTFIFYGKDAGPLPRATPLFPSGAGYWQAAFVGQTAISNAGEPPAIPPSIGASDAQQDEEDVSEGDQFLLAVESLFRSAHRLRTAPDDLDGEDSDPEVAAVPVLLEGGRFCFVRADETARIQVVRLSPLSAVVEEISPTHLEPGMCLVRRVGGSDNALVKEIADSILGGLAPAARQAQREYKEKLRELVAKVGAHTLERQLLESGMLAPNVKYRIDPETLRTRRPEDFQILATRLGYSAADATEMWAMLGDLQAAHQTAGQRIRDELERRLASMSRESLVRELDRRGEAQISVPALGKVSLSVLLIKAVVAAETPRRVPRAALHVFFNHEDVKFPMGEPRDE